MRGLFATATITAQTRSVYQADKHAILPMFVVLLEKAALTGCAHAHRREEHALLCPAVLVIVADFLSIRARAHRRDRVAMVLIAAVAGN